ncbi:MAG TPA: type II toxin-antitoxin system VapC family toxin [Roseiarcus sp.]|jgi:ribonuclease VapC
MMFLDASAIVAILNDEPGVEEIKRRLDAAAGPFLVSPLALFESTTAIARARSAGAKKPVDAKAIAQAKAVVAAFVEDLGAREIIISGDIGRKAVEAAGRYGKVVGHQAALNFGDCFAYACAKAYRAPLLYKGEDFSQTDLA